MLIGAHSLHNPTRARDSEALPKWLDFGGGVCRSQGAKAVLLVRAPSPVIVISFVTPQLNSAPRCLRLRLRLRRRLLLLTPL